MIESKQNKRVKQWKKLHRKKYRDQTEAFLIEGWHLVEEAIKSDWTIQTLIMVEDRERPEVWSHMDTIYVSQDVFKELSQTETPQGIMAVVRQNKLEFKPKYNKILLVDAVQDPGNIGTMIRSALAFDIDVIVLGKGSVDLYHDKVIRATQGAMFHIPIIQDDLELWINYCQQNEIMVYGTALDKGAKSLNQVDIQDKFAVMVGNEGHGVSSDYLEKADETVYIPIHEQSESLNVGVATSIVLYHFSLLT
ncbi:TrmH family RNA methyltransferase [Tenuibacillus multivorans]|uniref:RNA methyltransferase, TrmH family n=1 Tax=Tenuibacillus multivorans TaxID=237069 RepID=A0A1G9ZT68_9BACI|nr:RNA methyltransferase [Tenuibacillus multivorans]GEL76819.1 23S rRNA methyltransferase [Tenuibacillus multivorans]SDN23736.1 RNA methyltransferase, TrmH family [Tenuibacillus multivorans]